MSLSVFDLDSESEAWCGDTRALLLHGRKVLALTEDHVPKRRIGRGKVLGLTRLQRYFKVLGNANGTMPRPGKIDF